MGKYRDLLISAKDNNSEAVMELYKRCQPTIKKYSYVNGKFDEDLYQNLVIAFLGVSGASAPLFLLFVVSSMPVRSTRTAAWQTFTMN